MLNLLVPTSNWADLSEANLHGNLPHRCETCTSGFLAAQVLAQVRCNRKEQEGYVSDDDERDLSCALEVSKKVSKTLVPARSSPTQVHRKSLIRRSWPALKRFPKP
jgi:hypothetical protein